MPQRAAPASSSASAGDRPGIGVAQRVGHGIGMVGLAALFAVTVASPGATRMHSWPWTVVYAVALVAPALQLLLRAFNRQHPLALPSIGWCIALLFAFAGIIASALASPYRGSAVLWSAPLLAGGAAFFVVFDWIHGRPTEANQRRRRLLAGTGVFLAAIAGASVGHWLAHLPGYGSGNILAARNPFPLGHSNYTAGLGLLMLPCFVVLATRASRAHRIMWSIAALLAATMLLTSGSRGGFLGLAALVLVHIKTIARTLRVSLPVVFLGGTIALAVFVYWNPRTRAALAGDELKISDVQRAAMVQAGWHMGIDRPFLGWGPGTTPLVYPRYRAMLEGGAENVLQLHSLPIQIWAELGGVNALAVIALLILALRAARKVEDAPGTLFALSGYLVFSVTDWQLDVPIFAGAIAAGFALLAPPAPLAAGEAKIYPWFTFGGRSFSIKWREDYAALRRLLGFMMLLAFTVLGIFGRRDPAPLLNVRALGLAADVNKNPEAAALLRQSLRLNPDQEIAHFNLGWLLVVSEPTAAETHFLAAARLVPDKGGVYFGLGLARLNQGRRADAERAFAMECLNDPAFLVSPWWRSPGVMETRTDSIARLLQFYSVLLDALPEKSPLRSEARYARELAIWVATGTPVNAANTPARTAYFEKEPTPHPFQAASIITYRRERTGYPVLMRNLDLPVPTDLFDVQENSLATGEFRFLFPAKGWLASPLLPALLLESDSRQK